MTATVIVTVKGLKDTEMLIMYIRLSVCGHGWPIHPSQPHSLYTAGRPPGVDPLCVLAPFDHGTLSLLN